MQADSVAIAALRPRLEKLTQLLERVDFSLPTDGSADADHARVAIIRTINEYLIPRLDEPEAPVVAAVIGPSGTGKSTVVNSLANDRISDVGPLRPTTRGPVLWAHSDHGGRYWSEFVARVRERVGPTVDVVIGDDELTKQLTVIDTPPSEFVAASGRKPAVDALALADLCVFVTSPSRYADISAWRFLREIRWRGVPMLFVLNRLPPDREEAVALLNDFASRLHSNGLLLEPDAAMVFGINEALGDRWHGGLDPAAVGALRNELGAVSNSGYRETLVSTTAYTTGRNVVDRSRLVLDELARVDAIATTLGTAVDESYQAQVEEIAHLMSDGALREMAQHGSWSEAAVDLTAVITRRAGVAAQETARRWIDNDTGSVLLEGKGTSLWRHTEDTSWDVQGRLEEWEETLQDVAARHTRTGSLSTRVAKKLASNSWRLLVDSSEKAPRSVRRRIKSNLGEFVKAAQESLDEVIGAALEVDAGRFRGYLVTDPELVAQTESTITAISALLHGELPQLESVPEPDDPAESAPDGEVEGA
ncbi:MAG: GTPase domain-containing protein [Actinomycetota bacterium]|nr:GTPase domain-containing protein [Actinomycetota bacterium]